jgi:hypothetical protein
LSKSPASTDRLAFALTATIATAARKTLANPASATLARRRLARTVAVLASQHAGPQAVRAARKDADTALTAVLNAGSPAAAQAVMNGIADRQLTARPASVRHASLRAAAAITPEAKIRARTKLSRALAAAGPRMPTIHLGRLEGVWAVVYGRRERLLRRHRKAVAEAWDAATADLKPRSAVRAFRKAAAATPGTPARDTATIAALVWLEAVYRSAALVAALSSVISDGQAEGEADAIALAADRHGITGADTRKAFLAALALAQADPGLAERAREAVKALIGGAAYDVGRKLASMAAGDASEDDMAAAVQDAISGDQSRSVSANTDWTLHAAILAGAVGLYQRLSGGILLDWITAGDDRVCARCAGYEDNGPYSPDRVPGYPHTGCRCITSVSRSTPLSHALASLIGAFTG